MDRDIEYRSPETASPVRISRFLRSKGYSRQCLIEFKKQEGSVTVNGHFRRFNEMVSPGDLVQVHIRETDWSDIEPASLPLDILYEDEDIIAVNKPAGMPTHPSPKNYDNSLASALLFYYRKQGKPFVFRCCNRLDRDTSGVTVVSKHLLSAGILSEMGAARAFRKEYLGIVKGAPVPSSGTIDVPLGRKAGSIIERCPDPQGESAHTVYRTAFTGKTHSLVLLQPKTGRTHQLRVHMKSIGCPLIGDYLYNPDM